jgi:hypothetical protein
LFELLLFRPVTVLLEVPLLFFTKTLFKLAELVANIFLAVALFACPLKDVPPKEGLFPTAL